MAAKRDVNSEMRQGDPDEANTAADGVDALVSSFLAELTDISSEMTQTRQPKQVAEDAIPRAPEPGETSQLAEAEKPQPSEIEQEVRLEPNLDLQEIRDEVEETLIELERLKSEGIPAANPGDSKPAFFPPPVAEPKRPAAVSTPKQQDVESKRGHQGIYDEEEPTWDGLEVFRTRIVSVKSAKRRKIFIFALAPMILAVILGSFFLSDRIASFFKFIASTYESRKAAPSPTTTDSESLPDKPAVLLPESKIGPQQQIPPVKTLIPGGGAKVNPDAKQNSAGKAPRIPSSPLKPTGQLAGAPSVEKPKIQEPSSRRESQTVLIPSEKTLSPAASAPAGAASQSTPPPVSATTRPKRTDEIVIPVRAEVITKVQPVYPLLARTQRISGTVELDVEINDQGNVVSATAISGPELLRSAAEEAVKQWKFKPASFNGVNMSSRARISVAFNVK